MVIGCSGSGKSTFSRKIADIIEIPIYHLDKYYWKPNWTETKKSDWEKIVAKLAALPNWIIDGNYGGTMDIRIKEADTIIYLDRSSWTCLWRVIKRIYKYHGQVRPDMPEGCKERFDFDFLHYVAVYNITRRKWVQKKLAALANDKEVLVFKSDKASERYLRKLRDKVVHINKD